jgi:Mrp family chromosome partitioning ATPase
MIVNAYAEAYIADGIRATVRSAEERAVWMEARLEDLRAEAQAAAEAAEQFRLDVGVADQQGLRELEQQAEALERPRAAGSEPLPRTGARKLLPGVGGPHPVARVAAARPRRAACHPHVLAAGVFLGLLWALPCACCGGARNRVPHGADVTRTWALPFLGYVPPARGARAAGLSGGSSDGRGARSGHGERTDEPRAPANAGRSRACPRAIWPNPAGIVPPRARSPSRARGRAADPFRAGRARRLQPGSTGAASKAGGRVIAVAALQQGEDSSAIALELAHQSIHAGRRCLLVDARSGAAALSRASGLAGAEGTLDVLDGTHCGLEAALHGEGRRISMSCPSGQSAEAAPAMAYLAEFGELIGDLADGYDDIVIALPPLLDTPEARASARADMASSSWWPGGARRGSFFTPIVEQDPGLHARARAWC